MRIANQPETRADLDPLTRDMTATSLDQALRDFEIANARVLDLTARLVTASNALAVAEEELADVGGEVEAANARAEAAERASAAAHHALASINASRSVRAARLPGRVLRRLGR